MLKLPFLSRVGNEESGPTDPWRDSPSSEDPLPTVLEADPSRYVLSRETRLTEVKPESTDER